MQENAQKPMNIYQKLQKARVMLNAETLKKSGMNSHTKRAYFEIGDFLPHINRYGAELGFATHFVIMPAVEDGNIKEKAVLKIIDTDEPNGMCIEFSSTTAEVGIQGGQAIQNLGGKHTYMRRYLLVEAFEISENDTVETEQPRDPAQDLDQMTVDHINSAETSQELIGICKKLTEDHPEQRDQIEKAYSIKNREIKANAKKEAEVQESMSGTTATMRGENQ